MNRVEIQKQYEKNEYMLHHLSHQCAHRCGRPEEDVFSEACGLFMKATISYDEKKGPAFATYMFTIVRNGLIGWGKKMDLPPPQTYDEENPSLDPTPFEITAWKDWLASLNEECQDVVNIIFSAPGEIINQKQLQLALRKQGWMWKKIKSTVAEIRELLFHDLEGKNV